MKKVREGYKITELGEIPNEWEVKRLGEIAEINPKKEIVDDDNLVSFIAMEDISNSGRVINKNDKLYGEVKKGYTGFKNNDVLLAKITPCFENGKRALVNDLSNGIGFGSTEFHVLRATKESRSKYLYYVIGSHKFISKAENNMTGSAGQKRVPTEFVKDYVLAIPTIEEQEKIASILSTVDEQIDNVDELIKKNKELKKGLMQQLLTKGIGHTKFKKTEIGEIPEEWEVSKLGSIVEVISGATPKTNINEYWDNGDIYWATPTDITSNGKYISITEKTITESGLRNCSAKLLPIGSILMSSRATIGERCINTVPMATNQGFKSLVCEDGIYNEFIYYYVEILKEKLIGLASGSTFLEVSKKVVEDIKVVVPSLKEQEKIASILSEVDEKIEEYENKKQKLEELKKGLMQQLLTGKIRISS